MLSNYCRLCSKCAARSVLVHVLREIRTPTDHAFEIGSVKYVWWEVKNILPFVLFADYWYLQSGLEARGEEETASGSRYPWISRVKKKKKREDVCFRKSQDRTREACFLYPLFKQPYSCCNSPSILVHSGGIQSPFWSRHSLCQSIPFSPVWAP